MAARKKLSKAARDKLSRAAKRRPRIKTGPKKGQFIKGGSRRPKKGKKKKKSSKNVIARRPKSDPNRAKPKKKKNPGKRAPAKPNPQNRGRSLVNAKKIGAAKLAAGTGFREMGESLMRGALPVLGGVAAFRADEWFTDDIAALAGVNQHGAAGKAIRAVVIFALGMGIDLLVRRDGKAMELRMTAGEFVRNAMLVKLLSEVSADFIEPGVLRLKDVPGMRLIMTKQPALPEGTQTPPAPAAGASGVGRQNPRNQFVPRGSIRRATQRPNALGIIMRRAEGIGLPGRSQAN